MPSGELGLDFLIDWQLLATSAHTPPKQYGLGAIHTLPQLPQLVPLALTSTSQPVAGFLSQSANPGRHESRVHMLLTHEVLALGMLHCGQVQPPLVHTSPCRQALPHPPQF